jgi:hypothetical protein
MDGRLTLTDKETAIFMAFSPLNANWAKYDLVLKSIPKIKGIKRSDKRLEFAYDLIEEMSKNGLDIQIKNKCT